MGKMSISFRTHDHQKMSLLPKSLDQGSRPIKNGHNPASFCLFSSFSQHNNKYSTKFDFKKQA